ncbi:MAG: CBS domain-containing protein [Proteobacteria bacterium]|nr:CBS domain-containing protein [Pseudomonadota bacterium]
MKASEVMAKDVVTVGPKTSVKDIAELMTKHRISGVPVVDDKGDLVGILSETDLMHRAETGTERKRKWWLHAFVDADKLAREYAASHARRAEDIMTDTVVTVDADATLAEVANLFERRKLKRLPVTRDGRLAGIITRGDLVRALAARQTAAAAAPANAKQVAEHIRSRMRHETWLDSSLVNVQVEKGVAELTGFVTSNDQHRALRLLVEGTPGVTAIDDKLHLKPRSMPA